MAANAPDYTITVTLFLIVALADHFHCTPTVLKGNDVANLNNDNPTEAKPVLNSNTETNENVEPKVEDNDRTTIEPVNTNTEVKGPVDAKEPSSNTENASSPKAPNPEPQQPNSVHSLPRFNPRQYPGFYPVQNPVPYPGLNSVQQAVLIPSQQPPQYQLPQAEQNLGQPPQLFPLYLQQQQPMIFGGQPPLQMPDPYALYPVPYPTLYQQQYSPNYDYPTFSVLVI
ncbi:hypothetical protein HF086_006210 [Spodoptera exigua]|uniref:Uncharacterized protein n=1 Tax=Spodoptera exigua TaxID=7107 RepID=A0A922MCQ3_SPOEX|nr:hypothetical protein HF086_006210 [Spodoptera exigua]